MREGSSVDEEDHVGEAKSLCIETQCEQNHLTNTRGAVV